MLHQPTRNSTPQIITINPLSKKQKLRLKLRKLFQNQKKRKKNVLVDAHMNTIVMMKTRTIIMNVQLMNSTTMETINATQMAIVMEQMKLELNKDKLVLHFSTIMDRLLGLLTLATIETMLKTTTMDSHSAPIPVWNQPLLLSKMLRMAPVL